MSESSTPTSTERDDILTGLRTARHFLRYTANGLTDEQAAQRPTVSVLSVGGLIKHVTEVEHGWARFMGGDQRAVSGDKDFSDWTDEDFARREKGFAMQPGETLDGLLAAYDEVARSTDQLLLDVPSLDTHQPLPKAPWHTSETQSIRLTFLHIIAETRQHAGHADIIRESLDGQKSMG